MMEKISLCMTNIFHHSENKKKFTPKFKKFLTTKIVALFLLLLDSTVYTESRSNYLA